jgi:predicted ATP-binding protein involved in virulence
MRTEELKAYLSNKKIIILGASKTGKTTLSNEVKDRLVIHTDEFLKYNFEEVPFKIMDAVKNVDSYCVEGMQSARALRKGLKADVVIVLKNAMAPQTDKHLSQWKGVEKIINEWFYSSANGAKLVYFE